MKNFCFTRNQEAILEKHISHHFIYQHPGETVRSAVEALKDKTNKATEEIPQQQASHYLSNPKELSTFIESEGKKQVSPEDALTKLINAVKDDQPTLEAIMTARLALLSDPTYSNEESQVVLHLVLEKLLKYLKKPNDDLFKKIDGKIPDYSNWYPLKAEVQKNITDVTYKATEVKKIAAKMFTKRYAERYLNDADFRTDGRSPEINAAETVIRSIKDGKTLNEISNFLQDQVIPSDVTPQGQKLIKNQRTHLLSVVFDQRDWKVDDSAQIKRYQEVERILYENDLLKEKKQKE